MAHSADGFIARTGERTKLNNNASWQRVYAGRAKVDAVMIGINTVLIDNPSLKNANQRVVIDTHGRFPATSKFVDPWVISTQTVPHAKTIQCPLKNGHVDMRIALETLATLGINTIICEGGATLAQSLNDEQLIDDLILIECPVTLGGGVKLPIFSGYKPAREEDIDGDIWRYYSKTL